MSHTLTWDLDPTTWQAFVDRCPRATFFHTPGWYQAQAAVFGYRPTAVLIRFDNGQEALLPLATRRIFKGLMREALSGIETGYGGWVSPEPLTSAQVNAAYALVRKRFPQLRVTGNPHEHYPNMPSEGELELDATQVVPIVAREEWLKSMSETRVKHMKRAAKEGFEITVIEGLSEADVERFYPLYAAHAAEWQYTKWQRDQAYFRSLCRHAGDKLVLFLASKDGELAGFRILGVYGPVVMDLYLATAKAHEKRNVGPHLVDVPLAWCLARGLESFDFQPSGQLEGVKAYKASFGAHALAHTHVTQTGWMGRSLKTLWQLGRNPIASRA